MAAALAGDLRIESGGGVGTTVDVRMHPTVTSEWSTSQASGCGGNVN